MSAQINTTPGLDSVIDAIIDGKYDGKGMTRLIEAVNMRTRFTRLQADMKASMAAEVGATATLAVKVKVGDEKIRKEITVTVTERFNAKAKVRGSDGKVYKVRYGLLKGIKAPAEQPAAK